MRRSLLQLGVSAFLFLFALTYQAVAGEQIGFAVAPPSQDVSTFSGRADWTFIPSVGASCNGELASVRVYVGENGAYNNYPGLTECGYYSSYYYYYGPKPGDHFYNHWYGESGWVAQPRFWMVLTHVYIVWL